MGHWLTQGLASRQADMRRGRRREAARRVRGAARDCRTRADRGRREEGRCVRDKEVGKYVRKYDDEKDERGAYMHA